MWPEELGGQTDISPREAEQSSPDEHWKRAIRGTKRLQATKGRARRPVDERPDDGEARKGVATAPMSSPAWALPFDDTFDGVGEQRIRRPRSPSAPIRAG